MKRLFLDTNVILDLLAERNPFYFSIAQLATLADQKKVTFVASPVSFTTASFILSKFESVNSVLAKLQKFAVICEIGDTNQETIDKSLISQFSDFEDAVQYYCAIQANCSIIITRNGADFKKSAIPVMTANEYLKSLYSVPNY